MTKWDLYQICKVGSTFKNHSYNLSHQQFNEENHIIMLINAEMQNKHLIKQYPFMIFKKFSNIGIEEAYSICQRTLTKAYITSQLLVRKWTFYPKD